MILSDGLDYYIDALLMREGVGFVPFRANHLVHDGNRVSGIDFPYFDTMDCTMCGNCKLHHLENKRHGGYYTIYVGNGYSDRCPAGRAELVLAKGELLDHCRREGISCVPFENFRDVERELTELEMQWGRTIGQTPSPVTWRNPLVTPYNLNQGP